MINRPARAVSVWIKNANPEKTTSIEIMEYALSILFNTLSIIVITLIMGYIFGKLYETIIVLISFTWLRFFSGGFHIRSSIGCILVSVFICTSLPHLPEFSVSIVTLTNVTSIILLLLFAPNIDQETKLKDVYHPVYKCLAVGLVSINFIYMSSLLAITFFVQCLTIIPLKREG
ncbi:accessory gene regulator ArgB-like protein [Paenibacillus tyrfis]|uniref:accessory gene regulator ArgB-like protein n=1 Tax=Paenibacillus tyrfis TaxID=1501230 RepID=UPI000B588C23